MNSDNTGLFGRNLNIVSQEVNDIFFIEVGIAIFVDDLETVLESKFRVVVPILDFLKNVLNPIKLFIDVNFGRFLIVDERKESFGVDHL